jgi:hypothetical protein
MNALIALNPLNTLNAVHTTNASAIATAVGRELCWPRLEAPPWRGPAPPPPKPVVRYAPMVYVPARPTESEDALLEELRRLREELERLRKEVEELRRHLAARDRQ